MPLGVLFERLVVRLLGSLLMNKTLCFVRSHPTGEFVLTLCMRV